jgi:hypothetical protein
MPHCTVYFCGHLGSLCKRPRILRRDLASYPVQTKDTVWQLKPEVPDHPSYSPNVTPETVWQLNLEVLDHPSCGPNVTARDFYLFGPQKEHRGIRYVSCNAEVKYEM